MVPRSSKHAPRAYLALGHLLFLGLFILAYIHTMPRVVHVDSAFQIFKWIHAPGVGVEAHRFTAVVPQLLVKAAATTGASLKVLLTVASLAHVLVPYALFLLIAHVLRLPWIAVALVLAQVLCTRLTFYGIVLEANYLLSYPFLLAAIVSGPWMRPRRPAVLFAAVASLFLVLLVHPVGFMVALFVLALLYLRPATDRPVVLALMGISLVWPMLSRVLFPPTAYEASLYRAGSDGVAQLAHGWDLPLVRYLIDHTWNYTSHYLAFWCVLLALVILLVRCRDWIQLGLCSLGLFAYIALNAVTYHHGETAMMMEKNLLPLAPLVVLPFILELEKRAPRVQWIFLGPFILLLFVQFRGISFASRPAKERLAHVRSLVEQCREEQAQKACVTAESLDAAGLHIHWALAFETLLLSSVEGPEHGVSVVSAPHCPPTTLGADLGGLIDEGELCGHGTRYFRLPSGKYAVISPRWTR